MSLPVLPAWLTEYLKTDKFIPAGIISKSPIEFKLNSSINPKFYQLTDTCYYVNITDWTVWKNTGIIMYPIGISFAYGFEKFVRLSKVEKRKKRENRSPKTPQELSDRLERREIAKRKKIREENIKYKTRIYLQDKKSVLTEQDRNRLYINNIHSQLSHFENIIGMVTPHVKSQINRLSVLGNNLNVLLLMSGQRSLSYSDTPKKTEQDYINELVEKLAKAKTAFGLLPIVRRYTKCMDEIKRYKFNN